MPKKNFTNYKEIIDRARSANIKTLESWYSLYNLKEDPFDPDLIADNSDLFVNREKLLDSIIYDIGIASRGIQIDRLIVGPKGIGKSSLVEYINQILLKLTEQDSNNYSFNGLITSANDLFSKRDEFNQSPQKWTYMSKEKYDYVIIEDVSFIQSKTIVREFSHSKLRVLVISPLEFDNIYRNLNTAIKVHFLKKFDFNESIEILNKRILKAQIDEKEKFTIKNLFDEEALKFIYDITFGIPYLLLLCVSLSLRLYQNMCFEEGISIDRFQINMEIAERACKITNCYQAYTFFEKLSDTKMKILNEILVYGKSPSSLSLKLNRDRTTISKHLSELKELGLVVYTTKGRKSIYEATEPIKIRMEIEAIPKGER